VIEQHIRQWAAYAFDTLFQSAYQSAVVGLDSSIPYVSGRATHESPAALFQLIGTHSDKLQQAEGGGRMTALLRQLQAELVKIPVVGEPLLVSTFEPRQLRHALHGSLTRAASRLFSSSALRLVPARCVEAYKVVERIRSTRLPSPLLTHNGSLSGSIDGSFAIGATTNLPLFMGVSDFSHFLEMYGELTIESENEVLEIAEYLHDSASLVLSPSKRQVCSDMHVLSRLMLPYGYRSSTVLEIQVSEHAGSDRSIISLHDALVWIEKVCDTPSGSPHRDSLSLSWSSTYNLSLCLSLSLSLSISRPLSVSMMDDVPDDVIQTISRFSMPSSNGVYARTSTAFRKRTSSRRSPTRDCCCSRHFGQRA